ncbi:MAG: MerR family transcriptional regulator [Caldilineales bacterium]|nr:MerR family transcriptional regulator [Caldilineales bacterium]
MSWTPPTASSNETPVWHRPAAVAERLAISVATLRRWSRQFDEFLSPEATGRNGRRRYTDADLQLLSRVHELLHMGLSYEQARRQLRLRGSEAPVNGHPTTTALVLADADTRLHPGTDVAGVLVQALHSVGEGQQVILAQHQALRQLVGVLVQDNLQLKEENSRLRERMLEAERKLFELKRELAAGQAQERERLRQVEAALFDLQRQLDGLAAAHTRHPPEPISPPTVVSAPPPAEPPSAPPSGLSWWQRLRAWLNGA